MELHIVHKGLFAHAFNHRTQHCEAVTRVRELFARLTSQRVISAKIILSLLQPERIIEWHVSSFFLKTLKALFKSILYLPEHLQSIVNGLKFFVWQKFRAFVVPRATQMRREHACRDVFLLRVVRQILVDGLVDIDQSLIWLNEFSSFPYLVTKTYLLN